MSISCQNWNSDIESWNVIVAVICNLLTFVIEVQCILFVIEPTQIYRYLRTRHALSVSVTYLEK